MSYPVGRYLRLACMLAACAASAWAGAQDIAAGLRQAEVLVGAERYKDAVAVLKTLEARTPEEQARIGVLTGTMYLGIERAAKAVDYFEEALTQAPGNLQAALGAARAHL